MSAREASVYKKRILSTDFENTIRSHADGAMRHVRGCTRGLHKAEERKPAGSYLKKTMSLSTLPLCGALRM